MKKYNLIELLIVVVLFIVFQQWQGTTNALALLIGWIIAKLQIINDKIDRL